MITYQHESIENKRTQGKFTPLFLLFSKQAKNSLLLLFFCQAILKVTCESKDRPYSQKSYEGKNPAYVAPKKTILDANFDGVYTLKINTSNVDPKYVALCVVMRNENIYDIYEFLSYHYKIGIGRIYLYDTGSTIWSQYNNSFFELFSEFLGDGRLYYQYWKLPRSKPGGFNMQTYVYNNCAKIFAKNHVWLGFIDIDEFIVLRNGKNNTNEINNIQDFLKQYEEYGGLSMNWVVFGTSGIKNHQKSSLKSYTKCYLHRNFKTFVNVRFWSTFKMSIHNVAYNSLQKGSFVVDEDFQEVKFSNNIRYPCKKIVVHHYTIKSEEDFEAKVQRGSATGYVPKLWDFYDFVNNHAKYTCTEGVQLYEQLFKIENQTNY